MQQYVFQYCQKLVVFDESDTRVLLARRTGEQDYNATYTFIGGKMETSDQSVVKGMQREKNEEIGQQCTLLLLPDYSYNVLFRKKDGNAMIVANYYARFEGGDITLSDEYDDYKWVNMAELEAFEPKIGNTTEIARRMLAAKAVAEPEAFVLI